MIKKQFLAGEQLSSKKRNFQKKNIYSEAKFKPISNFISHLSMENKNYLEKFEFFRQKHFYDLNKKTFWKCITKLILAQTHNHLRILESLIIGKRLSLHKILAKFLSFYISRNFFLNFFWKMALNLENKQKASNFKFDFILLHGIRESGSAFFFSREYLNFKIRIFEESYFILLKNDFSTCYNTIKIKYLEKILMIICCNLLNLNLSDLFKLIITCICKKFWAHPHLILSFEEVIYILKLKNQIFKINLLPLNIINIPDFPVLRTFWLFSNIKESLLYSSILLQKLGVYLKFNKYKTYFDISNFSKNTSINSKKILCPVINGFYLYQ